MDSLRIVLNEQTNDIIKNLTIENKQLKKESTNQIYEGKQFFEEIVDNGFVQKTHKSIWVEKTLCEIQKRHNDDNNHAAVFTSAVYDNRPTKDVTQIVLEENDESQINPTNQINYNIGYIAHRQIMKGDEFSNCSLCEIERYYKPIFNLTDEEVKLLEDYMSNYQILRRCCGMQMSKYNRLRLHGCDVTEYKNDVSGKHRYPWCENHDFEKIENEFMSLLESNGMAYRSIGTDKTH